MKIVLTDAKTVTNGDLSLARLETLGEVVRYDLTPPDTLIERVADADAVICNKTVFTADVMKHAPKLRYIGLFATGFNNIDVAYAGSHSITVCNAGSYSTDAVAQNVFAHILHHYNRVADYNAFVQKGGWQNSETFSPFVFPLWELAGKTIGIVGYGSIGKKVAQIARAFSMRVIVHTRTKWDDNVDYVSLETLAKESDIITLHCPLNDASTRLINAEFLANCKNTCLIVNTSRGGVIDEPALRHALDSGIIGGAAIDVLTQEPMAKDCVLYGAKNITFTPHIAWAPLETRKRLFDIVYDNLAAFLDGHPKHVVS